jgi:hypothetical protein
LLADDRLSAASYQLSAISGQTAFGFAESGELIAES